jgi:hypothetical protein
MTRNTRVSVLALCLSFSACTTPPMPPPSDAMPDAHLPPATGPRTFTLEVAQPELEVVLGERVTLEVRVVRTGGFDEPVLVELAGLPETLVTLARESRVGDETTTLTIVTDEDGAPIPRSAFAVQATTLDGLRQIFPAHITVRERAE